MKTLNHNISEPLQRALRYTMILSALLAVGYVGHHTGWSKPWIPPVPLQTC